MFQNANGFDSFLKNTLAMIGRNPNEGVDRQIGQLKKQLGEASDPNEKAAIKGRIADLTK